MSLCAIIPVASMQAANDALEQAGYGPRNFSVPLYNATGAAFGGLHAWDDPTFIAAVKAVAGVVWEESSGEPMPRFQALAESQGTKWGATAPPLPSAGMVTAGELYRDGELLWYVIQSFDRTTFNAPPETYPALIRNLREPYQVLPWKQPLDQFDAYKLLNPFTNQNDECTHNGKKWYVTEADGAGNNTWEPGVFGWSETDPTPNILVRFWNWLTGLFSYQ